MLLLLLLLYLASGVQILFTLWDGGVTTSVGPAEKVFNLQLLSVNINSLQVNLTCYLLSE